MSNTKKAVAKPKTSDKDPGNDPQGIGQAEPADECQIGADLTTLRREQKQIAAKIKGK